MNLLIDESVDRQVVDKLRQDGHNVVYVSEMDPGISDDVVLSIANNMGALLVTADRISVTSREHAFASLTHASTKARDRVLT